MGHTSNSLWNDDRSLSLSLTRRRFLSEKGEHLQSVALVLSVHQDRAKNFIRYSFCMRADWLAREHCEMISAGDFRTAVSLTNLPDWLYSAADFIEIYAQMWTKAKAGWRK